MTVGPLESPDDPPPSLHPHYQASQLPRGGPPLCPAPVLSPSQNLLLGVLPCTARPQAHAGATGRPAPSGRQVPTFRAGPRPELAPPSCRTPPGQSAGSPQAHPEIRPQPRFRRQSEAFDTSSAVHLRSPSRVPPDALIGAPFPQRSPPRLLTDAACGGLQPPPAGRLRRATPPSPAQHRHHRPSLYLRSPPTFVVTQAAAFFRISRSSANTLTSRRSRRSSSRS